MTAVSIPARFCGPSGSGNGGYVCGITAGALAGENRVVEVSLLAPPPLEQSLELERNGDEARLLAGETVIAVARPAEPPVPLPAGSPPLLSRTDAVAAADAFDIDEYRRSHDFPSCYTCGPDRAVGDGLRIFPAATDRPDRYVWPWTPHPSLFGDGNGEDRIDDPVIWAALDCPSGLAWIRQDPEMGAIVLANMITVIHRSPAPGEPLVVAGWSEDAHGRRRGARSVIHTDAGEILAAAVALWVVLTEEQRQAFAAGR